MPIYSQICPLVSENIFKAFAFSLPWEPEFYIDLSNLDGGPPKDYLCEVSSKLTKWFKKEKSFKAKG